MIRTQIQLTEEQARRLREVARERGVSMAEVVRRCIDRGLAAEVPDWAARYARAVELVGAFDDPKSARGVAGSHDDYLDDAYAFDRHFEQEGILGAVIARDRPGYCHGQYREVA